MTIRPKPSGFAAELPPPGVELKLYPKWRDRPDISCRGGLTHTNGANSTGSVESAFNWATSKWGTNAMPHYQVDLSGRAAKFLPTNKKGICNYKADWFFFSIETADLGWGPGDPGTLAAFTQEQMETIAHIWAYEAIVHKFPIQTPTSWDGTGLASHTDPFAFPLWTNVPGKQCPGEVKKAQVRNPLLGLAQMIVNIWLEPPVVTDPETGEDIMDYCILPQGNWWPVGYDNGNGPAWFIRFKSGLLIHATGPDMDQAAAASIPTRYCKNKTHYNNLLRQSGSTSVSPIP